MFLFFEDWDYIFVGLFFINWESIDVICIVVWEFEKVGYIIRWQGCDEKGKMIVIEYIIYEQLQFLVLDCLVLENLIVDKLILENLILDNLMLENLM